MFLIAWERQFSCRVALLCALDTGGSSGGYWKVPGQGRVGNQSWIRAWGRRRPESGKDPGDTGGLATRAFSPSLPFHTRKVSLTQIFRKHIISGLVTWQLYPGLLLEEHRPFDASGLVSLCENGNGTAVLPGMKEAWLCLGHNKCSSQGQLSPFVLLSHFIMSHGNIIENCSSAGLGLRPPGW